MKAFKAFYEWLYEKLTSEGYLPDEAKSKIDGSKWIVKMLNEYHMELWDESLTPQEDK